MNIDTKGKAEKISRYLLDSGILDHDWQKIFIEMEYYKLCSLISSLTRIKDKRAEEILSELLVNPLYLERRDIDEEQDCEIRSLAASYFLKKYHETGDDVFINILIETLIHSAATNIKLTEYIVRILSDSRTKDVVIKSGDRLLDAGIKYGDYDAEIHFYLFSIIVSIGGDVAVNILCDYFELYSDVDNLPLDVFFQCDEESNKMLALLINSRVKRAHKLLSDFLDYAFLEYLSYDNKKKCIIAAGRSKAKISINNLRSILFNQDESIVVRRKAVLALGMIRTNKASKALREFLESDHANSKLKTYIKEETMSETRKHDVSYSLPEIKLGNADVVFEIRKNSKMFGTLKISIGNMVWLPYNGKYERVINWDEFDSFAKRKE